MEFVYAGDGHFMNPDRENSINGGKVGQLATSYSPMDCPFCFDVFTTVDELRKHKRVHHQNNDYGCKICRASFVSLPGWQYHYKGHNSELQHLCDSCNLKFKSFQQLVQHIERHKYFCSSCDKAFVRRELLRQHERNDHFIVDADYKSEIFYGHRCPKCNENFRTHTLLCKHRKENAQCCPYSCEKCGKGFLSEIHMQSHTSFFKNCRGKIEKLKRNVFKGIVPTIRLTRLELPRIDEPKSYVCHSCDQRFAKIQLRREHWIRHRRCRPYGCSQCEAKFVYKTDLETHAKYHMHKCLHCLVTFPNKSNLDDHRCTTLNENSNDSETSTEKLFECLYCCETYSSEQQLQDHTDYVSEYLFICSKCFDPFKNKCTFGYHLMTAHGVDKLHI